MVELKKRKKLTSEPDCTPSKTEALTPDTVKSIAQACLSNAAELNGLAILLKELDVTSGSDWPTNRNQAQIQLLLTLIPTIAFLFEELWKAGLAYEGTTSGKSAQEGNHPPSSKDQVSTWIKSNQAQFIKLLLAILDKRMGVISSKSSLASKEAKKAISALQPISVAAYKAIMLSVKGHVHFRNEIFERLVLQLLKNGDKCPVNAIAITLLMKDLEYDDVRIFWLRGFHAILMNEKEYRSQTSPSSNMSLDKPHPRKKSKSVHRSRLTPEMLNSGYTILMNGVAKTMPSEQEGLSNFWSPSSSSLASLTMHEHRKAFSECWLTFLSFPRPAENYKEILTVIHKSIIPHMTRPSLLIDFLVDSYNQGGVTSLLALNGLFTLIQKHNLDYPNFYRQLYALFDAQVMQVKYRSRFFRMVDLFLSSTLLPSYLVAAFIKRIARLALLAPPAATIMCIPMIFNLLHRHPSCMPLIHRTVDGSSEASSITTTAAFAASMSDPYDAEEEDPAKCKAIDSCLWEVVALQNHYLPSIASLARIFEQPFKGRQEYDMEDFLDHTYGNLFTSWLSGSSSKRTVASCALNGSIRSNGDTSFEFPVSAMWQ